ncbi:MAG: POTRA domain-containing protein [Bacteroidota bacterium]
MKIYIKKEKKYRLYAWVAYVSLGSLYHLQAGATPPHPPKTISHTLKIGVIQWKGISMKEGKNLEKRFHLSKKKPFSSTYKGRLEKEIADHLKRQGYAQAKVKITVKHVADNQAHLVIHVKKKGKRILGQFTLYIDGIIKSRLESRHLSYVNKGTTAIIPFQIPYFVEEKVIREVEAEKRRFQDKGYRDVEIQYKLTYRKDSVDIRWDIKRNKRYYTKKIKWVNNVFLSDQELSQGLQLAEGQPYSRFHLKQVTDEDLFGGVNIYTLYEQADIPVTLSSVEVREEIKDHQVYLQITIQETPRPKIAYTRIHKNGTFDKAHVQSILAEHHLTSGEKFSRVNVPICESALVKMDLFQPHTIWLDYYSTLPGKIGIDCYLLEKRSFYPYAEIDLADIKLGFQERNFDLYKLINQEAPYGGGQRLTSYIGINPISWSLSGGLSWEDPWFSLRGFRTPLLFECHRTYKQDQQERPNFKFLFHASQERKEAHPHGYDAKMTFERKTIHNPTSSFATFYTFSPEVSYQDNQTDNHVFPTRGQKYKIRLKAPILVKKPCFLNTFYLQWLGKYQYFHTRGGRLTYVYTAEGGVAFNGDENNPFNRLILGDNIFDIGASKLINPSLITFRGYSSRSTSARYAGSTQYGMSQSFELRLPLLKEPLLCFVIFFDTAHTDRHSFLFSTGAEIRIKTPLCTVSFYLYFSSATGFGMKFRLML